MEILMSLKLQTFETQSYQVDLLAKSEIFDRVAIVWDVSGIISTQGSGSMLPQEIYKSGSG